MAASGSYLSKNGPSGAVLTVETLLTNYLSDQRWFEVRLGNFIKKSPQLNYFHYLPTRFPQMPPSCTPWLTVTPTQSRHDARRRRLQRQMTRTPWTNCRAYLIQALRDKPLRTLPASII